MTYYVVSVCLKDGLKVFEYGRWSYLCCHRQSIFCDGNLLTNHVLRTGGNRKLRFLVDVEYLQNMIVFR